MTTRTFTTPLFMFAGILGVASVAKANYVETFTGGSNVGGWTWNVDDTNPDNGGNPGGYLANGGLDTFGPILTTTESGSPFTGNLRAAGVTGMSFDLRIDHTDFQVGGDAFSVSLLLRDKNGTDDFSDDDYAFLPGAEIPEVGSGWAHYDYALDAASTDLPTGWFGGGEEAGFFRPGVTWSDVVTNVDQVEFWLLEPGWFAIFQNWSVGADNIAVTAAPVPEPATLAALGLGSLLMLRRKRSRK